MKKRILSFILVCVLVLSLGGSAFALDNPPTPSITIGSVTVSAGQEAVLPLTMSVASGYYLMSFGAHLTHPDGWTMSAMRGPDSGPIKAGMNMSDPDEGIVIPNPITFNRNTDMFLFSLWDNEDLQVTLTGDILAGYLRVTVPAGTADGNYEISLDDITFGIGDISNPTDTASVAPNLTPGVITVTHTHEWNTANPEWTWEQAESGAWSCELSFGCNVTGCTQKQTVDATVTESGTQPTCTEAGSLTYTAKATFEGTEYTCPETKTATPAATGHKWVVDTAGWSWSDATPPTASVALKCSACNDTVNAEAVVTEKEGSTSATCDTAGSVTYVATTNKEGAEYKNEAGEYFTAENGPVTTPASGHNYSVKTTEGNKDTFGGTKNGWTWTQSGDSYTAKVAVTCANATDGSHDTELVAEVTSESTAVCGQPGTTTYTAIVYKPGSTTEILSQDTLQVTGETTPHQWTVKSVDWTTYNESAHTVSAVLTCGRAGCSTNGADQSVTATVTIQNPTAPTCTTDGTEDRVVSGTEDGTAYSQSYPGITVDKLGHEWVLDTTVDESGWTYNNTAMTATATFKCNHDGCTETQVVNATEKTKDESNAPTCDAGGSVKIIFTATPASKTEKDTGIEAVDSTEKTFNLEALGHDYTSITINWTQDSESGAWSATAVAVCSRDASHTTAAQVTVTPETTNATCTTDGSTVYTAVATYGEGESALNKTESKTVDLTHEGHTWGEVTFDWSQFDLATGTGTVTASRTCSNEAHDTAKDGDKTQTMTATVTPTGTAATCTAAANRTFTASAQFEGMTEAATDSKADETAALGHLYGDPTITWAEVEGVWTATALFHCTREGCTANDVTDSKAGTKDNDASVAATCAAAGKTVYTATFGLPEGAHHVTDKTSFDAEAKEVTEARLDHVFGEVTKGTPAGCLTDGTKDYYLCTGACGLKYPTNVVTQELSAAFDESLTDYSAKSLKTQATGHDLKLHEKVDATCDNEGTKAYYTCDNGCGMIFADDTATTAADDLAATFDTWKVIPANKHSTLEVYEHVNATFENDGNYAYAYCPVCKQFFLITDSENPTAESASIVYYNDEDAIKGHTGLVGIDANGDAYETNYAAYIRIPMKTVLYGDVNGDGSVDSMDYSKLKQYLLRMITADKINMPNADCNGDGKVDSMDYSKLKQYLLRMITKLGPA